MIDLHQLEEDLRFDLLRNAIYHTARGQFLDLCTRSLNFVVIALGTSAAAEIGKGHIEPKWLAAAATFAATIQLVGDLGVSARVHFYLQRRCYELLSELEGPAPKDQTKIAEVRAKLTVLYGEEPPPMRALDAVAYNAACDSVGKGERRVKISWFQSAMRQFYPFNGTKFIPKVGNAAAA
ncbi:hypothetical protein [Methylocystis rosea]|uniref:SLATT domain-containing protein n=1 Tax=Methylocystis rosea TaxID=173366 RepID=A0A3G8M3G2_9HYPH|nr:hypothetical protein [Methylocystis rosea]AZG75550.1 hypothetical protein EHO51_01655 [Methylocystis rosea]